MDKTRTTNISWCQKTWNPVTGCEKISDGCKHCYAEKMAKRIALSGNKSSSRYMPVIDTEKGRWTGNVRTWPNLLDVPLGRKTPTVYFVGSMTDMFHKDVPFEFLAAVFAVMASCPQHRFLMLTKRPERMHEFVRHIDQQLLTRTNILAGGYADAMSQLTSGPAREQAWAQAREWAYNAADGQSWPLPNVALGTSVEHQVAAGERIPLLRDTPAHRRFLSVEPMLGPVRIDDFSGIHMVIIGCESGHKRRATKLQWIQDLGRSVLDARTACATCDGRGGWPADEFPVVGWQECSVCMGSMALGPALHIKQADVCEFCGGRGFYTMRDHPDAPRFGCHDCGGDAADQGETARHYRVGSGRAGKVRKDPNKPLDIYIPGYGTRTWRQEVTW